MWAQPSTNFSTSSEAPPELDNGSGATDVWADRATLNGRLLNGTGGHVYFLWGTDESNWAHTNDMSILLAGPFSTNLLGLARNTAYKYRCYATNAFGSVLSAVTSFTTRDEFVIGASTNLVAAQSNLYAGETVVVTDPGTVLSLYPSATYGTLVEYRFTNLRVTNGATVVCYAQISGPNYDADAKGVAIRSAGDVMVSPGTSISADNRGFANQGPGKAGGGNYATCGNTHGGVGGDCQIVNVGTWQYGPPNLTTYGSFTNPTSLGSANGATFPGAGAIRIAAGGDVKVDGAVSASCPANTDNGSGASAGGSVWIEANRLLGTGRVAADGATHLSANYDHGGGGGGRVAVYASVTNAFTGTISAYGGAHQGSGADGAAGTVFIKQGGQAYGSLIVDNRWQTNTAVRGYGAARLSTTNDNGTYTFDSLILRCAGQLEIAGTETLNVSQGTVNNGQGDNSGRLMWLSGQGTLALPSAYVVSNYTLVLNNGTPAGLTSLTLSGGGRLAHTRNTTTEKYKLDLNLTSLTVGSGCSVDVSGSGYAPGCGPSAGYWWQPSGNYGAVAGSHGGEGGSPMELTPARATYGSATQPTNSGSGGMLPNPAGFLAHGGGVARIQVSGGVTVDGSILADGSDNVWENFASPGAGGSIWITCGTLSGAGQISAIGGAQSAAYYNMGGGSGGRIALYADAITFNGSVTARGGAPRASAYYGGAGTIYRKLTAQATDDLIVNNASHATPSMTRLATTNDAATWTFNQVALQGNGALQVAPLQTVDVSAGALPVLSDGTGLLANNGTFALPASHTISNYTLAHNGGATGLGGVLQNLTVASNGVLTHTANGTTDTYRLALNVQNLTVNAGGSVTADGCGFAVGAGPGAGSATLGATYAGIGYNNGAATYGSATAPTNHGSGAAVAGGGVIKLVVPGVLTVNGTLSANGTAGSGANGGGAGGSIWIAAGSLAGSGNIRANAAGCTAGGGGGRVAIGYTHNSFAGLPAPGLYNNQEGISASVTAKGGYHTGADGVEDGSIYIQKIVPLGTLLIVQ